MISLSQVLVHQKIHYEFQYPLELELKYFIDHLDGSKIKIASGESAMK